MERTLEDFDYDLALEISDGKWNHVEELKVKPASASMILVEELSRRCPGQSQDRMQQAIADGMFSSR